VAPDSSHGQAINLSRLSALGFLGCPRPPIADRRPADGKAAQPGHAQAIALTTMLHRSQDARPAAHAHGAAGRLQPDRDMAPASDNAAKDAGAQRPWSRFA
jgi:hypothetical protein